MGLFTQKPQEPSAWAALPGEPLDEADPVERLDEAPALDPMDIGVGAKYTTMVFPVAPPAPEAADVTDGEPGGGDADSDSDSDSGEPSSR
jgi:hypothetical protein